MLVKRTRPDSPPAFWAENELAVPINGILTQIVKVSPSYRLSEYEVMILAGHASFETTRKFYMAVRKGHYRASSEGQFGSAKVHFC